MNEVKPFTNEIFGTIRTMEREGQIYFVGKDVAEALGYQNQNRDIVRHVDEEDRLMVGTQYQNGIELGQRGGWLINESGLYSLITASKLQSAKKFKHWVTSEVLPSIRKHGAYITQPKIEEILANPDIIIELATTLKKERAERQKVEAKLEEAKPKMLFADAVVASDTTILIGELAKIIKQNGYDIGQKRMFSWLRQNGYLINRKGTDWNSPTQRSMEMGLFKIHETVIYHNNGEVDIKRTTRVTGKGQTYFVNKFLGEKHA